jgi:membrane protease YdiL (CAAX protease family)
MNSQNVTTEQESQIIENMIRRKRHNAIVSIVDYLAIFIFGAVILSNVMVVLYSVFSGISLKEVTDSTSTAYSNMNTLLSPILEVILYLAMAISLFFINKEQIKKDFIAWKPQKALFIGYAIIGVVAMYGINIVLSLIFTYGLKISNSSENQQAIEAMMSTPLGIGSTFIFSVLLAPFVEEMVFRKSVFAFFKNKGLAIFISSLLFGFLHVFSACTGDISGMIEGSATFLDLLIDFSYIIIYGGMGAVLAILYKKCNENIFASITCHCLNNLFSFVLEILSFFLLNQLK